MREGAVSEGATLEPLAAYLKALSHPKRLQTLVLTVEPHSLDAIAEALRMTRQSAEEHVVRLVDVGFLEMRKVQGKRGALPQYVTSSRRLFAVHEMFAALGSLESDLEERVEARLPTVPDRVVEEPMQERDLPRVTVVQATAPSITPR